MALSRRIRLTALLTLGQLVALQGIGAALALAHEDAPAKGCRRSCCDLAKAGSSTAVSCCALRCEEASPDRSSEPASSRFAPAAPAAFTATTVSTPVADGTTATALSPLEADRADSPSATLFLQHALLLV